MICLNMIVKNEALNIEKVLESVKPFIDYYLIADTGSTDNTVGLIKQTMGDIPGEVLFHAWENFGANRERILQCAYKTNADYCMVIDGDEVLQVEDPSVFDNLTADCYHAERQLGDIRYETPFLINMKKEWHWKGVVHNYLSGKGKYEILKGVVVSDQGNEGGKSSRVSSRQKYLRDAFLLEAELEKNPNDTRSQFYLAQSYKDAGEPELALKHYQKRAGMGGWAEEVYYSLLSVAALKWQINKVFPTDDYLRAYDFRPTRREAVYELVRHFRAERQRHIAYLFAKTADKPTTDGLFVRKDIEDWGMKDELAVSAYWVGEYRESERLCDELLSSGLLPEREIERIKKNREYAIRKLEKGADYYNRLYQRSTDMSRYEDIYKKVGTWAEGRVLDICCGTGELSKYIQDYSGFDFSEIAGHSHKNTWQGNAYTEDYEGYDTYVALEVFEHLDDLRVIERIPVGKRIIFSVPSFPDPAHIRTYTEDIVRERYKMIDIEEIVRFNWSNKWIEGGNSKDHILLIRGNNHNESRTRLSI